MSLVEDSHGSVPLKLPAGGREPSAAKLRGDLLRGHHAFRLDVSTPAIDRLNHSRVAEHVSDAAVFGSWSRTALPVSLARTIAPVRVEGIFLGGMV